MCTRAGRGLLDHRSRPLVLGRHRHRHRSPSLVLVRRRLVLVRRRLVLLWYCRRPTSTPCR